MKEVVETTLSAPHSKTITLFLGETLALASETIRDLIDLRYVGVLSPKH